MRLHSSVSMAFATFLVLYAFNNLVMAQKILKFDLKGFDEIEISSAFTAEISQSEEFQVIIECDEAIESHLKIELEGNELSIGLKGWKTGKIGTLKAVIKLPTLKKLEASGASQVTLIGINNESLELELSGASRVIGNLVCGKTEFEISGASQVKLDGRIQKMTLYVSGASSIDIEHVQITDELVLDVSGASQVNAFVDGDMFVKLSGASSFVYSGSGEILKQEISGGSEMKKT